MSRFKSIAKTALLATALLCVGIYLARNAEQLANYPYSLSAGRILDALAMALLAYLLGITIWARIANTCGVHADWRRHARVWSVSRLGRYVPGKLAAVYLRMDGYAENRARAGVSLYIEITSSLFAACGFILVCWLADLAPLDGLHAALMTAALLMLAALSSPHILRWLANRTIVLRSIIPPDVFPGYRWWAITITLQVAIMLLQGTSLYFAILAVSDAQSIALLELTVYYYFAGLAGMLALFAPAGIGVREAVLVAFLQTIVPLPAAVAGVALARIITVAAECLLAATFRLLPAKI